MLLTTDRCAARWPPAPRARAACELEGRVAASVAMSANALRNDVTRASRLELDDRMRVTRRVGERTGEPAREVESFALRERAKNDSRMRERSLELRERGALVRERGRELGGRERRRGAAHRANRAQQSDPAAILHAAGEKIALALRFLFLVEIRHCVGRSRRRSLHPS